MRSINGSPDPIMRIARIESVQGGIGWHDRDRSD
jgi:hypothetical protein